ncbi:hypothetical protein WNY51_13730 [Pseudocolwellia sp. AS88]|uniref:hypothetical protein n=1 Tax=Pseudocolwellia sp. AS88 TaxID=3063958 RepID=UPI0026EBF456|nr:hypothetical protein [Pseudocolwellia sp. AS88]MDO7083970.1 hypothetical protein [Pseudocolwellia sp. AS88]
MSILLEFVPSLFVAFAFDFLLYKTGATILSFAYFSTSKNQTLSYSEFKESKKQSNKGYLVQYIVGILFYALFIVSIAWLN